MGVERGKPCASEHSAATGCANPWNIIKKELEMLQESKIKKERKGDARTDFHPQFQAFSTSQRPFCSQEEAILDATCSQDLDFL